VTLFAQSGCSGAGSRRRPPGRHVGADRSMRRACGEYRAVRTCEFPGKSHAGPVGAPLETRSNRSTVSAGGGTADRCRVAADDRRANHSDERASNTLRHVRLDGAASG